MKFISLAIAFLLLIGCGSSPSPVLPPVELTSLKNQIKISRIWKFTAGEGISDFYLKLRPVFNKRCFHAEGTEAYFCQYWGDWDE